MQENSTVAKSSIRDLILKALAFHYTSHSCKDDIATGNHYQSISLGGVSLAGFRSSRNAIFDAFDFEGSSVLDIGSNLGETSRLAARRGASSVRGVEYDAFFVLMSNLINLHEDLPPETISFECGDITKKFNFDRTYDFILAFSVFTYMGHRLAEISKSTQNALILETHNVEDEASLASYLKALSSHFPFVITVGDSDWGIKEQFAKGRRVVLAGFHKRTAFWKFIEHCQSRQPLLSSLKQIDLVTSDIAGLRQLLKRGLPSDDALAAIPDDVPAHVALNEPYPSSAAHLGYWVEFRRGYLHAKVHNGEVTTDNPYIRWMRQLIADGCLFDPGAMEPMRNDTVLLERCKLRLSSFSRLADPVPVVFFNQSTTAAKFTIRTQDEEELICTNLDGQHRLAAAIMAGMRTYPVYHFPLVGTL